MTVLPKVSFNHTIYHFVNNCGIIDSVMNDLETRRQKKYTNPAIRLMFAMLCCALWGSAFPGIKLGYQWLTIEGTGSQILFAGIRFTLAGIFTIIYCYLTAPDELKVKRNHVLPLIGQGLLQTAISYIFFYVGLAHMTGSRTSIINSTGAFFSLLFAGLVLRSEKLTARKWLACFLGFGGVIILNIGGGESEAFTLLGDGAIILSAIASGIGTVTSKSLTAYESPVAVTGYQLGFGGLAMIILGLAMGGSVTGFELKSVLLLLYLAGLSTVAFIFWTKLLKYNQAGRVSVYGFMTPVFGVILSGLVLGESVLNVRTILALAFVASGVLIINSNKNKNKESA